MQVECTKINNNPASPKEQETINKSMFFGFKISQKISDCCKKIITIVKDVFFTLLSIPSTLFNEFKKIISKKDKDNKEDNKTVKVEHVAEALKGNENLQTANNEDIKAKEKAIEISVSVKGDVDQENQGNNSSNETIKQSPNEDKPLNENKNAVEVISQPTIDLSKEDDGSTLKADGTLKADENVAIEASVSPEVDQKNLKEDDISSKTAIQPQKEENIKEKENVKEKEEINEEISPQQEAYYAKLLEECELVQKYGYKFTLLKAKLDAKGLINFKNLLNKVHSDWAIFDQLNMPWEETKPKKKTQSSSAIFAEVIPAMNTKFFVAFNEKVRDQFMEQVEEGVQKLWDKLHAYIQALSQVQDPSITIGLNLSEFDGSEHLMSYSYACSAFIDKVKTTFPSIKIVPMTLPFLTYWGFSLSKK